MIYFSFFNYEVAVEASVARCVVEFTELYFNGVV